MDFPKLESLLTLDNARGAYSELLEAHELLQSQLKQSAESAADFQTQIESLKADQNAALEKEQERVEALSQDLAAANALLDEAGKDNAEVKQKLHTTEASLDELTRKLTQAQAQLETSQAKVSELEGQAKDAEARAAQICASVGVDPVRIKPDSRGDQMSLLEQMRAITNPAKQMSFFRKHREAILRGD